MMGRMESPLGKSSKQSGEPAFVHPQTFKARSRLSRDCHWTANVCIFVSKNTVDSVALDMALYSHTLANEAGSIRCREIGKGERGREIERIGEPPSSKEYK